MNVIFVISAVSGDNTGAGGHYYSLLSLANAFKKRDIHCSILALGDMEASALKQDEIPVRFLLFKNPNFSKYVKEVRDFIASESPTHIHAFDNKSYALVRYAARNIEAKLLITKPGGAAPKLYFPWCKDIFVFSQETAHFFRAKRKFAKSRVHLIPNRVDSILEDEIRVKKIRAMLPNDTQVFLRICRISSVYAESIVQMLNLVGHLREMGMNCVAVLVGVVQDQEVYLSLKDRFTDGSLMLTDDEFTTSASSLIGCADVCVATGRGVMEAAGNGKIVLTTLAGSRYPVIINEKNISELKETNFSPRNKVDGFSETENLRDIYNTLTNDDLSESYRTWILDVFRKDFSLEGAVDRYLGVYQNASTDGSYFSFDLCMNFVQAFRFYGPVALKNLMH